MFHPLGEAIMFYAASIYSDGYNQPAASNVLHGTLREKEWLPRTIVNSASSRSELDTQLVMDRLLREYLTPKSRWE